MAVCNPVTSAIAWAWDKRAFPSKAVCSPVTSATAWVCVKSVIFDLVCVCALGSLVSESRESLVRTRFAVFAIPWTDVVAELWVVILASTSASKDAWSGRLATGTLAFASSGA